MTVFVLLFFYFADLEVMSSSQTDVIDATHTWLGFFFHGAGFGVILSDRELTEE